MSKKIPKIEKVRQHLLKYGSITQWECYELYNYTRLADGIHKLRKKYDIETVMHYKNGESFAQYVLKGVKE